MTQLTDLQIAEHLCELYRKYHNYQLEHVDFTKYLRQNRNGSIETYGLVLTNIVRLYRTWMDNPLLAAQRLAQTPKHDDGFTRACAQNVLENGGPTNETSLRQSHI